VLLSVIYSTTIANFNSTENVQMDKFYRRPRVTLHFLLHPYLRPDPFFALHQQTLVLQPSLTHPTLTPRSLIPQALALAPDSL